MFSNIRTDGYSEVSPEVKQTIVSFFDNILGINLNNDVSITFLGEKTSFYSEVFQTYLINEKFLIHFNGRDKKIYSFTYLDWLEQNNT
ncbi:MAG: hypothetical protein ACP5UA_14300, partial [Candidatus Hydrogenedens sp.]